MIGFPHGGSTPEVKVFEAKRAVYEGGKEVDYVINIGRLVPSFLTSLPSLPPCDLNF